MFHFLAFHFQGCFEAVKDLISSYGTAFIAISICIIVVEVRTNSSTAVSVQRLTSESIIYKCTETDITIYKCTETDITIYKCTD